ncbi:ABC transporter permease [Ktedonospora formicarum]|uniref:ABC transporter permease n=1 Tax=Ktedonospora formicarum TaxID=2778364 RepID=A0A8J3MPY2_9CHLR|nr:ABC transporter permease [Ktedonospora formicarum]GHO44307.1 ABC transporter permease [Ktedonospora formicarum]
MALPPGRLGESHARSSTSKMLGWLYRVWISLSRPLFAVALAMVAGSILILITAPGSLEDRLNTVVNAYQYLLQGSFGDPASLSYTLVRVGPLILAGLSVSISYRAGLFNIGAAGQIAVGAMTAGIIAFALSGLPGIILVPLMIIGSMVAGGIWGGIVGLLKAWRGVHEVVTTIMLNWIAFYGTDYLISGPFKAPQQSLQTPAIPAQAQLPAITVFYNQTLGQFLPPIENPEQYLTDVSLLIVLVILVAYWFITTRTAFGYEIRVIGNNPRAAKYAGIRTGRNLFLAMAMAGALSGLAGAFHLMGQAPYQLLGSTFAIDPTGFDALGVALLGRTTTIGVLLSSLLFGGLRQGGTTMQLFANVPGDLAYMLQALVLFSIASEFLPAIIRALRSRSKRAVAPAIEVPLSGPIVGDPLIVVENETVIERELEVPATAITSSDNTPEERPNVEEQSSERIEEGH